MVERRYNNAIQMNFYRKNLSENKINSEKKFTRASQSPTEAVKALRVRKTMAEVETYQKNLTTARGIYDQAEEAVKGVSAILQELATELIKGATGTYETSPDKQIIGERIESLADSILKLMNLNLDRRIFGGVNNTTPAFDIQNGIVMYNGVPANNYSDPSLFPNSRVSYMDVGMGLKFLDDFNIDPQTAIPVTFNGAKILGSGMTDVDPYTWDATVLTFTPNAAGSDTFNVTINGTVQAVTITADASTPPEYEITPAALRGSISAVRNDDGTVSIKPNNSSVNISSTDVGITTTTETVEVAGGSYANNIIQLVLDAAKSVKAGTDDVTARYADLIYDAGKELLLSIASIGSQQAIMEFNQERLTSNMTSLKEQQNDLEGLDIEVETTNWKILEAIYGITLQMSATAIPVSIFNYIK
jgi:flagellin-like hook-associated protein FlgL